MAEKAKKAGPGSPVAGRMVRLLPPGEGTPVQFSLQADPKSRVFVAGTFNGWDPGSHRLRESPDGGFFSTALLLPAGTHEYKFVVDGAWVADPSCPECAPNDFGSTNSVLRV